MNNAIISNVIYFAVIIALFYFALIRPQQKKQKEAAELRKSVKKGNRITTVGGIMGLVTGVDEDTITIETGSNSAKSTLKLAKWALGTIEK
jgi:preprotein translocase subunit YajC